MSWHIDIDYLGEVKVLAKGQIVIPKEIRDKLAIKSGDLLKIMLRNDGAIGLMREEDVIETLQEFQQLDLNKQENIAAMQDMQQKVNQIMQHLKIHNA